MADSFAYHRARVLLRDRGVCAVCDCDTLRWRRIMLDALRWARRWENASAWTMHVRPEWKRIIRRMGFNDLVRSPWEADHIEPRCRGGADELDNLRTLCVECHKRVTRGQRGE